MIVVDEHLDRRHLLAAFAAWYQGRVIPITALRPHTVVKGDAIPSLLVQAPQPTFVTINVSELWTSVIRDSRLPARGGLVGLLLLRIGGTN